MRFLSSYSNLGNSYSLSRNTGRGFFFVDCRAATNSALLFPSCKRVARDKVRGGMKGVTVKQIQNLVVLLGKPNSGKTATMHAVVSELIKKGATWLKRSKYVSKDGADFTVQLLYCGKKIYLASRGDDKPPMERNVRAIVKFRFDVSVVVVSMPAEEGSHKAVYEYYREEMVAMVSRLKEVEKEHLENPSEKEIGDSIRLATKEVVAAIDSLL